MVRYLMLALLALTVCLDVPVGRAQSAEDTSSVFVGPFASWRQVTCGGVDDTDMLQAELDSVGTPGHSPVLYINPGTCRISQTLLLGHVRGAQRGKQYISILGADPATTSIVWSGSPNMPMLRVNGVAYSRFGRLTWDGGGTANAAYVLNWDGKSDYFPTGNRHEYEVFQNLDPTIGVAIKAGTGDNGEAETEVVGCHFIGPYAAGVLLYNFNVLDWWIWDSEFRNLKYGVTNFATGVKDGAGGYSVNRSNFIDNDVDLGLSNTNFFSSRWNYSRNAGYHVLGNPQGNAPSPWTSQGETVIDPRQVAFQFGTPGPLGLLDTTVRGTDTQVRVAEGYSPSPQGDVWSLGSTFSSDTPYADRRPPYRRRSVDDQVSHAIDDPGPLALPATPQPINAPLIEVQGGDIQGALNAAGDQLAVVHIPYGDYQVTQPLRVGPNVILTGDGYGATRLIAAGTNRILYLPGPSHAVLRDFSMQGTGNESGIVLDAADTPGGVVHAEAWMGSGNHVGLQAAGLSTTHVDLFDHQGSSNSQSDFQVSNSRVDVFNGAGANTASLYDVHGGEVVSQTMYYESKTKTDFVAPGSTGTLVLDGGKIQGKSLDTSQFGNDGSASFVDIGMADPIQPTFGPNILALGFVYGWQTRGGPLPAEPAFSGGPFAMLLSRSNDGGGGSALRDEHASDSLDDASFIRNQLAPLRRAVPQALGAQPANVEQVILSRVGGGKLGTAITIQATSGS